MENEKHFPAMNNAWNARILEDIMFTGKNIPDERTKLDKK